MGKTERKLKQAAEMLLSMDEGDKKRPSRPSKKDANRRFKAEIQDGRFEIKEVA